MFRDHSYCSSTLESVSQINPAVLDHDYSVALDAVAQGNSSDVCDVDDVPATNVPAATDPELEQLEYRSFSTADTKPTRTPAAAWLLTTLFLLYWLQRSYSDNVISELCTLVAQGKTRQTRQNQPYSKRVMIFCMTLAGYSWHAYSFLRTTLKNCLPCRSTLTKYRNKVDGSPGFSVSALKMVKNKVQELAADSKKLYLSLSCDDKSIRYLQNIVYFYLALFHN